MGTRDSHSLVTGGFDETPVSAACGNALEAPSSGGVPPKPRGDPTAAARGQRPRGEGAQSRPLRCVFLWKMPLAALVPRRASAIQCQPAGTAGPGGTRGVCPRAAGRCGRVTGGTRLGVPVRDVSAPCPAREGVTVTHLYLWGGPLPPETAVPQCPHNVLAEPS